MLEKQEAVVDSAVVVDNHIPPFRCEGYCRSWSAAPIPKFGVNIAGCRTFKGDGHFVGHARLSRNIVHNYVLNIPIVGSTFRGMHQKAVTDKRGGITKLRFIGGPADALFLREVL